MKIALLTAALSACLCLPMLRAEDEKAPEPTREPSPVPETAPKKEKPNRPAAPPRPREREKPTPKSPGKAEAREMRTWLGISTHPVDSSLREHLEIQEGFGIEVVEVMPDSPAASAGLRGNDVLLRFDDQRLISPEHLSILVRSKKSGDTISLTLIRKGKEEVVPVVLGEAEEDGFGPWWFGGEEEPGSPMFPHPGMRVPDASKWQEQIRRQQDEILRQQKEWMEKHRPQFRHDPKRRGEPRDQEPGEATAPDERPSSIRVSPGFPLRVFNTEGVLKIDNEQGELTLTRKDGDHHLVIQDASGKTVYDGAFDPEKGVEELPEAARKQLEAMKLGNLEIRLPETPEAAPEKTGEPKPTGKGEKTDEIL